MLYILSNCDFHKSKVISTVVEKSQQVEIKGWDISTALVRSGATA